MCCNHHLRRCLSHDTCRAVNSDAVAAGQMRCNLHFSNLSVQLPDKACICLTCNGSQMNEQLQTWGAATGDVVMEGGTQRMQYKGRSRTIFTGTRAHRSRAKQSKRAQRGQTDPRGHMKPLRMKHMAFFSPTA